MKSAVVTEACQKEFERLAFHNPLVWHVINDDMRKIRLAGDGAEGRKLRGSKAHQLVLAGIRGRHTFQNSPFRAGRGRCGAAKPGERLAAFIRAGQPVPFG